MKYIFRWNGEYFGFIKSDYLFNSNSKWIGWIEDNHVWLRNSQFLGDIYEGSYIVRKVRIDPIIPIELRVKPARPKPPIRPENRTGRLELEGFIDALCML